MVLRENSILRLDCSPQVLIYYDSMLRKAQSNQGGQLMGENANEGEFGGGRRLRDGERFRGYVVERSIGKGGLGSVYLVRHEVIDTPFALKVLDPEVAEEKPEYVKRFVREAKIASKIRHPNLVAVHDAGFDQERGVYYLVMDYVQGSTLRQAIALGGKMPEKEAVRIISCVASALAAAQRFGVVHRDIKPENIMLTRDGEVKLIDLGVAKVSGDIDSLKTMANTVFGTPAYMSPEQATDSSKIDARSDIYSLGIVFFEMLCGRSPYGGKTSETIVHDLLAPTPIPDIRTINPEVSMKVSALLMLMCEKNVDKRIKSSADLIEAFRRLGYDTPTAAGHEYADAPSEGGDSFSYQVDGNAASNNTLTFETQDEEVRVFVTKLRRKKRNRQLAKCIVAGIALVGALGLLVYLLLAR